MPKFLVQARYTATGMKGLRKEGGTSRLRVVEDVAGQLGGSVEALYFAFGDYDLYCILDLPDQVSMAAASMAVAASGTIDTRAVVLLTPAEIDAAAKTSLAFRAPGS